MPDSYKENKKKVDEIILKMLSLAPELLRDDFDSEVGFLHMHERFSSKAYTPKHSPFLDDLWHELKERVVFAVNHPEHKLSGKSPLEFFDSIYSAAPKYHIPSSED